MRRFAVIPAMAFAALCACKQQVPITPHAPEAVTARPAPTPVPLPMPMPAPASVPVARSTKASAPSASRDPVVVLANWARAVEMRDWDSVRAFWGEHGAASGLSEKAFAARWDGLVKPTVTIGKGEGDAGAGSLYYTAPVQIGDGTRRLSGEIVMRRVNDVDGASEEQLRWHIVSSTLEP